MNIYLYAGLDKRNQMTYCETKAESAEIASQCHNLKKYPTGVRSWRLIAINGKRVKQ